MDNEKDNIQKLLEIQRKAEFILEYARMLEQESGAYAYLVTLTPEQMFARGENLEVVASQIQRCITQLAILTDQITELNPMKVSA